MGTLFIKEKLFYLLQKYKKKIDSIMRQQNKLPQILFVAIMTVIFVVLLCLISTSIIPQVVISIASGVLTAIFIEFYKKCKMKKFKASIINKNDFNKLWNFLENRNDFDIFFIDIIVNIDMFETLQFNKYLFVEDEDSCTRSIQFSKEKAFIEDTRPENGRIAGYFSCQFSGPLQGVMTACLTPTPVIYQ